MACYGFHLVLFRQWGKQSGYTNQIGNGFPINFSSTESVYTIIPSILAPEYTADIGVSVKLWSESWVQFWRNVTDDKNIIYWFAIGK